MTREELISGAQSLADAGGLKLATLEFTATDVVKVVPAPVPLPTVTDLRGTWNASTGKADLKYTFYPSANPYVVLKDGVVVPNYSDSNGDAHVAQAKGTTATYRVRDAKGVESNEVRVTAGTVTQPPDPQTDPGPVVTDPTIPDNAIVVTVDEFNSKQQAGKNYLIKPGNYSFSDQSGLTPKVDGVSIYAEPGKVLIKHTGTLEFPRCVDVNADEVLLFGLNFAGPAKTIGIQFNSVSNIAVERCGAVNGDLGTFIESKGVNHLTLADCVLGDFRRYLFYGKIGGTSQIIRVKWGRSLGVGAGVPKYLSNGERNPKWFDKEHGIRIEDFTGELDIIDCEGKIGSVSGDKSDLNVKRRGLLRVLRGIFYNASFGPLGDKDGLQHKSDPAYVLRNALLDNVKVKRELRLELNCLDLLAKNCDIARVVGDDSGQYRGEYLAAGRKLPSATFAGGNVSDVGGVTSGFKFE